ncbi:MAG: hypothetical protein M1153_01355 [Patescibacteria group bacterium]|nr:hypothetical protein [Patescibacteria group bacterium]
MDYLKLLRERAEKSRVYSSHQLVGLTVAQILNDEEHKALFIRLAKDNKGVDLIAIARSVAEKKEVKNKGAYFMRLVQKMGITRRHANSHNKRQRRRNLSAKKD